ncbi:MULTISPECIES: MBL fold metallo-hydrolase [unclassified Burkholderia]|uniref:MBL fold metallo-hydrolase n=1 Tax=unclassified Burkholderia TaxID=2613784 RepID=UPI000B7AA7BA|nr:MULTISPECIES: MBL fold metallo-hydrolase [unclassified Burkholderia]MCA8061399.1 MBL fold metallo-hydrolase [Burkholderia sp. AU38729]OXI17530.1 MBL fold metallo-hydrolase [Burkholderia sp. AU15512]
MESFRERAWMHARKCLKLCLAGFATAWVAAAFAAAPFAGKQAPGFYRTMVGTFEVTALSDGTHPFPIDKVVEGVSNADIENDLQRAFLAPPVQGSINAFLVNTGEKLILIDAGAGSLYGDCCGRLVDNLRAAGYRPEQVDEVLLTHMHEDHIGGIASKGVAVFPNAVVRVSRKEADYWLNPANKTQASPLLAPFFDAATAAIEPYRAVGRFKTYDRDGVLEPGIRAISLPGHTPGQMAYLVESGSARLLVWGDVVHVAAIQLRQLQATVKYDSDPSEAHESRQEILREVADRRYLVGAAHVSFPGLGHVRKDGDTFDWVPVNYDASPMPRTSVTPGP